MLAVTTSGILPDMARKETASSSTEQANFRLDSRTMDRLRAYRERHHLHPTLTQIVEAAIGEWLDKYEPELPKKGK